ncbi:hypothetical protein [Lelliottia sp. JS-SCA-14]|uniref:hypothetical protein n=1 Tax=Lelliottia sp. JS-SCA-14 TaxID=3110110 RepID=UPI002D79318E|nr:hypothetical protein [Lelliottia sp. JS-SCA-14]
MNQRFLAFLAANAGIEWKSKSSRNARFICFIIEMKVLYLGNVDEHITEQDDFTDFIWSQVNKECEQAA